MSVYNNPMNPMPPLERAVLRRSYNTDQLSEGPWASILRPQNITQLALQLILSPKDAVRMNQYCERGFTQIRASL